MCRLTRVSKLASVVAVVGILLSLTPVVAAADDGHTDKPVIVVAGQEQVASVVASGYSDCAGQDASVFLIFPQKNTSLPKDSPYRVGIEPLSSAQRFSTTTVSVDASGAFHANLMLPEISPDRWTGYVGMAGDCLKTGFRVLSEVFYTAPVTEAMLAKLETGLTGSSLPTGSSVVIITSLSIDSTPVMANEDITGAEALDHVTVYANGQRCTSVDVTKTRDEAGDALVILGSAEQAPVCKQKGATLTFSAGPNDDHLNFETLLTPGTLQPIKLVPYPADTGSSSTFDPYQPTGSAISGTESVTPVAPSDGSGVAPAEGPADWVTWLGMTLVVLSLGCVFASRFRRDC